mmetsp:Transcript_2965/g.395  ORF Transcript_2965/g.395 Transcript_2965/m.395 type:complete len:103 (-) Transcript_2965:2006-2314(-)
MREGEAHSNPFLISGSIVTEGNGKIMICAVGPWSNLGKSREMMSFEEDPTPLQDKLEVIASDIGKMGIGAALILFIALSIYTIIDTKPSQMWSHDFYKEIVD